MVTLFGRTLSRWQIAEHCGALSQFAGVRLMTLADGVERDVRMLEFRTGSGLRFTVLVERAFDIADCEFKGQAIGWHSASGFRHPAFTNTRGSRNWPGRDLSLDCCLACGLDQILGSEETAADTYNKGCAAFAARES
jgi:Domain of unknown function (DUF4432)